MADPAHQHSADRTRITAELDALFDRLHAPCRVQATSYGGLGVVATRRVRAGDVVLHERPLLLTVGTLSEETVCARCLASCEPGGEWTLGCERCGRVRYCTERCRGEHVHDALECGALAAAAEDEEADEEVSDLVTQAIAALALRARGGRIELLPGVFVGYEGYAERLCGIRRTQRNGLHVKRSVLSALRAIAPSARVPPKELYDVLDRHQANVYGVLGPGNADVALASFAGAFQLFNHSCLPNMVFDCRPRPDDDVEDAARRSAGGSDGTVGAAGAGTEAERASRTPRFALVALVDIEKGEELVHCYASSAEGPTARRKYLHHHHGFACVCERCQCRDDPLAEAELSERLDAARCVLAECGSGLSFPLARGRRQCVHCGGAWEDEECDVDKEEEEEEDDDDDEEEEEEEEEREGEEEEARGQAVVSQLGWKTLKPKVSSAQH